MKPHRRRRPVITEAKLRKIIRDELARQHLVNEGMLDSLKAPFKKLGDKVKAEINKRVEEAMGKLSKMLDSLKSGGPMDEVKQFLAALKSEEQGGSPEEIISQVPELAKMSEMIQGLKGLDIKEIVSSEEPSAKAEGFTRHQLASYVILLDEQRMQSFERYETSTSRPTLNESVILTAFTAWWTFEKTVVGGLGILYWCLKFLAWVLKKFGFDKASAVLKEKSEDVHHLEESVLEMTAIPVPLQYATYSAYAKVSGKKAFTYDEFKDPKNKEAASAKKDTFKVLKFALLVPMLIDALIGLGQALNTTFHSIGSFAKTSKYAAKVASETGAVSKVASAAGEFAGEIGAAGLGLARRA